MPLLVSEGLPVFVISCKNMNNNMHNNLHVTTLLSPSLCPAALARLWSIWVDLFPQSPPPHPHPSSSFAMLTSVTSSRWSSHVLERHDSGGLLVHDRAEARQLHGGVLVEGVGELHDGGGHL